MSSEDALINMRDNILGAISHSLCPLLLETSAGEGTKALSRAEDYINFCLDIQSKNVGIFGSCLDTQHVFANGYDPYFYLKYLIMSRVNVKLIYYNDPQTSWRSKHDKHAPGIGYGRIPWLLLEKVAWLAKHYNIHMIEEKKQQYHNITIFIA